KLLAAPALAGLRRLDLALLGRGPELGAVLAGASRLENLTHLSLDGCRLGDGGGPALAGPAGPPAPRPAHLSRNPAPAACLRALAGSALWGRLAALDLSVDRLLGAGVEALASAASGSLRSLRLHFDDIGPEGARALASAPGLAGLTELDLSSNALGPEGVRAL